ncbi:hypothetical protein [Alkalimonas amylolytica]|uniref:Uncharacterized protein n=1 Tax=Alkalimonas amylolytica TaxID=152573 RepID=A0A1H4FKU9_ALKAM|nr:hypothetical protein [Alkalimonas amylolytica]SEA97993.1 hypothetical protein SAMN04488051_11150 [Alkalimonas amylolytica]
MINLLSLLFVLAGSPVPLGCFEQQPELTDFEVSGQGVIYRNAYHGSPLSEPKMVADLSASGWLFSTQHRVVASYLPHTAWVGQQRFEQLLLLAYHPGLQSEQLVVVRVFPQQSVSWQFDQLLPYLDDAVLTTEDWVVTALWQQQQQAAGWWRPIPGKATQLPELYAGILYLPVAEFDPGDDCPPYPLDLSVHIIHMHSGHTVSPPETVQLSEPGPLQWKLKVQGEYLGLWLQHKEDNWLLQSQLPQILSDCLQCTSVIEHSSWPKMLPVAHFWLEEGAY